MSLASYANKPVYEGHAFASDTVFSGKVELLLISSRSSRSPFPPVRWRFADTYEWKIQLEIAAASIPHTKNRAAKSPSSFENIPPAIMAKITPTKRNSLCHLSSIFVCQITNTEQQYTNIDVPSTAGSTLGLNRRNVCSPCLICH
jgi:hypothetical protein